MAAGGRGKSTRGRVGGSSQSSNPNSATQSVTQSKSRRPSQYPPSTKSQKTPTQTTKTPTPPLQHSPSVSEQPPLVRRKQLPALRQHQVPPLQEQPVETPIPEQQFIPLHQNPNYEEEDEVDDGEEVGDEVELLDRLLALPRRQYLPILSKEPIPGVETLWFNRHNGKLSRVISGIFRRKFDGPYISWKVTPIATQERYFRNFARKYYWDQGVTELVKEGSLVIAKKRMKGIVSQAKKSGEQPPWIGDTLWKQMWVHWNTEDAIQKSETASNCRNSNRGGLGVHKHLAGQKPFVQVHQEMEEKLKRRVSYGEVFMKTHIRADGSFVDQKSQHVGEAYVKMLEEMMFEIDEDGPQISGNSSQHSTHLRSTLIKRMRSFLRWQRESFWPWITWGDSEQKKKDRDLCELFINGCKASRAAAAQDV
ncbi:putative transposase Ptta/En/Spm plant [Arabidopsis suecica]|uniref:Putative transposase Ptta/En/Spm plant n=1 Tax=Arabidopsis suecica TaxID=45249 RepID=A0A8T2GBR8_ARASU|nr:putative transposase Ptta/En/Spm plant [Arabidopsis suecica]